MKAARALLLFELRRHGTTLLFGCALLLALPLARAVVEQDWNYWDDNWNVWGGMLALFGIAPILAISMAASGWASERRDHTLDWLYSRPQSSASIFVARVGAIVIAIATWLGLALVVNSASSSSYSQVVGIVPGYTREEAALPLALGLLVLALGCGLLASALTESAAAAMRVAVVQFLAVLVLAELGPRLLPWSDILLYTPHLGPGPAAPVLVVGIGLASIAAAWNAVRQSPDDGNRRQRALRVGAPLATVALVVYLGVLSLPLLAGDTVGARWNTALGDETHIELREASGTDLYHPVVVSGDSEVVVRTVFAWGSVYPNPTLGVALVDDFLAGWTVIDRDANVTPLGVDLSFVNHHIAGWSPDNTRFAWEEPSRILLLEENLDLRTLPLPRSTPSGDWVAAWIDDERLLLTTAENEKDRDRSWFLVMRVDGTVDFGPSLLVPSGAILTAPAFYWTPESAGPLQRLEGEPVLVLRGGVEKHFARMSLSSGELEMDSISRPRLIVGTLGNANDGSLLWAELEGGADERPTPAIDRFPTPNRVMMIYRKTGIAEPAEEMCEIEARYLSRFLGERAGWAAWREGFRPRAALCNLLTRETRTIDFEPGGLWDFLD